MFKKLFNRAKAASETPAIPATPVTLAIPTAPAPIPVVPNAAESKEKRLEAFREEWENQWETSHEVIEGNGSHTDWGAWTDAVEKEENSFAPTVPMPLNPK
jgi:hypothetical protein